MTTLHGKIAMVIMLITCVEKVKVQTKTQVNLEEPPRVVNFTVNGNKSVHLLANSSAHLSCEVDGIPTPIAYLNGSSLSTVKYFTNGTATVNKELTALTCKDAGRYFCYPINGYENVTAQKDNFVDINITCKPQLAPVPNEPDYENKTREVRISVDEDTVFTVIIYGYPEPTGMTVKVERNNVLEDLTVVPEITYTHLDPPFGLVTVKIPGDKKKGSTTYNLNVKNDAGMIDVRFNVIKEDPPNTTTPTDDTAKEIGIGVGVAAGVLLIATIVVVVICVVRRRRQRRNPPTPQAPAQYFNPAFGNNKTNLDIDYIN